MNPQEHHTHPQPLRASGLAVLAMSLACGSGATSTANPQPPASEPPPPPSDPQDDGAISRSITFRPDRVYEVTGIWVAPGQMEALMAYFGEVFPIAAEDYGVTPLFSLQPTDVYAGDFQPDIMFVNEWPSLERFQSFIADPRAVALFPRRDAATSRLVVTQYSVEQTTTVQLQEGEYIEFGAVWPKEGRASDLAAYVESVMPIARRHGVSPIASLVPVFSYSGGFDPARANLYSWGEADDFTRFVAEATPLFPRRDAALDRLEVMHARVHFEGGL